MLHVFYVQTLAFIWTGWALLGNIAGHLTMEGHACMVCSTFRNCCLAATGYHLRILRVKPDVSVRMGEQAGDPEARAGGQAQQNDRTAAVEVLHGLPPVRPRAVGAAIPLVDDLAVC